MQGFGARLRDCAKALGLNDSEVARRAGISQQRYAHYVSDRHEPDYETLLRICKVLVTTPNVLLGIEEPADVTGDALLVRQVSAAASALDSRELRYAAVMVDALVKESTFKKD